MKPGRPQQLKKKKKKPRKFLQWREFASLTEREYGNTHGMLSLL